MRRIGTPALDVTPLPRSDDWRNQAACKAKDADLFFPTGTTGPNRDLINAAKEICATCPVMQACLEWSLETGQLDGVWGGLDERERRNILRHRNGTNPNDGGRRIAPCGTRKAWERHRRNGEPIDSACKAARYANPLPDSNEQAA